MLHLLARCSLKPSFGVKTNVTLKLETYFNINSSGLSTSTYTLFHSAWYRRVYAPRAKKLRTRTNCNVSSVSFDNVRKRWCKPDWQRRWTTVLYPALTTPLLTKECCTNANACLPIHVGPNIFVHNEFHQETRAWNVIDLKVAPFQHPGSARRIGNKASERWTNSFQQVVVRRFLFYGYRYICDTTTHMLLYVQLRVTIPSGRRPTDPPSSASCFCSAFVIHVLGYLRTWYWYSLLTMWGR